MQRSFDMTDFMSRQALKWTKLPRNWYEGSFLGNGFFGASLFHNKKDNFILKLGHTEIYDNRKNNETEKNHLFLTSRLPLGGFEFSFDSRVKSCELLLDVYNAKASGTLKTSRGKIEYSSFIPRGKDILFFDYTTDLKKVNIIWQPVPARCPRQTRMLDFKDKNRMSKGYAQPHMPEEFDRDSIHFHLQPFFESGYFCVAYKTVILENKSRLIVTVAQDVDRQTLFAKVTDNLRLAEESYDSLLNKHTQWWHNFYKKSLVSIDEAKFEEFFYIQLYKLASAGDENGRVYDTTGPWMTDDTAWPGAWWNLNVQLTYSPLYVSNHLEIASSLIKALNSGTDELINNVPEKYRHDSAAVGRCTTATMYSPILEPGTAKGDSVELGNLTWALYYCMLHYKMTLDKNILTDTVYPLLRRSIQYYMHFLYPDENGNLHLPYTTSPEYNTINGGDCNYDLSLIRWGCSTLIEICKILDIADEKENEWRNVLTKLTDYPQSSSEGLWIAAETPYAESHRHYSHLLMFYPLHCLDCSVPANRELIEKSISFWQSKPESLEGYSQSGAASMYAMLGNGEKALYHLNKLFNGFIQPNTMYKESTCPVLETPPSALTSILNMLIQSYDGIISIFPALPAEWHNICFDRLLAVGGFEVSAKYQDNSTHCVKITSLYGSECIVCANFENPEKVSCTSEYVNLGGGRYKINLGKNETAVLSTDGNGFEFYPVNPTGKTNYYGMN